LLAAGVDGVARASAARLDLLRAANRLRIDSRVTVSGGAGDVMHELLRRDWRGRWSFRFEREATLRGLAMLEPV
jgi:hypothetical protein